MRAISHRVIGPLFVLALLCVAMPAQDTTKPATKKQEQSKSKSASASMKGCVDQQDGKYVLLDEQTMALITNLEADGFPTEGFAKHMGEKVTDRGTSSSDGARPVFRVRSIEVVSQACAPQQ